MGAVAQRGAQKYVEECVTATAASFLKQERPERTALRFLEHNDQRFRLSYVLGMPAVEADDEDDEDEENEDIGDDFVPTTGRHFYAAPAGLPATRHRSSVDC